MFYMQVRKNRTWSSLFQLRTKQNRVGTRLFIKTQSYHDECIIFELLYSYISCVRMKLIWSTTFRTTLGWILYILTTCSTFLLQFVNSGISLLSIGAGLGFIPKSLGYEGGYCRSQTCVSGLGWVPTLPLSQHQLELCQLLPVQFKFDSLKTAQIVQLQRLTFHIAFICNKVCNLKHKKNVLICAHWTFYCHYVVLMQTIKKKAKSDSFPMHRT